MQLLLVRAVHMLFASHWHDETLKMSSAPEEQLRATQLARGREEGALEVCRQGSLCDLRPPG